jgi:benzylsuccinate CoA-transferase BbsE subunit
MFAPLEGVRVIDLAGPRGAYAGRLLADLGADVVRVVLGTEQLASVGPHVPGRDGERVSAFELFVNLNKRSVLLDGPDEDDRAALLALVASADVVIHSGGVGELETLGLDRAVIEQVAPSVVVASVLPFGADGPRADFHGDDLTQLAAGGLLYLGGYADTEPIAVHGGQSDLGASMVTATGVLLALIGRERGARVGRVDVSAQEAVAGALEDAIPEFDLTGVVRRRRGARAKEAGTGTYPCADGYVAMVAGRLGTAAGWLALTQWMVEAGTPGADELASETWRDFGHRQLRESIERFEQVFTEFAADRTRAALYEEGQRRGIAIAPVNDAKELLASPQLAARGFFTEVPGSRVDGVRYPGRPYRVDRETAFVRRPAPTPGQHTREVLDELQPVHAGGVG